MTLVTQPTFLTSVLYLYQGTSICCEDENRLNTHEVVVFILYHPFISTKKIILTIKCINMHKIFCKLKTLQS